jgi:type I restriction enzyme M protein
MLIPLPYIETQNRIVCQIEKEKQLVDSGKELIQIYEQKIKSKIAEIWET